MTMGSRVNLPTNSEFSLYFLLQFQYASIGKPRNQHDENRIGTRRATRQHDWRNSGSDRRLATPGRDDLFGSGYLSAAALDSAASQCEPARRRRSDRFADAKTIRKRAHALDRNQRDSR